MYQHFSTDLHDSLPHRDKHFMDEILLVEFYQGVLRAGDTTGTKLFFLNDFFFHIEISLKFHFIFELTRENRTVIWIQKPNCVKKFANIPW